MVQGVHQGERSLLPTVDYPVLIPDPVLCALSTDDRCGTHDARHTDSTT